MLLLLLVLVIIETGVRIEQRWNTFHTRSLQHVALRRLVGDELHKSVIA
jgi:hypothetical protein